MILVDTSVWIDWSNRPETREAQELARLLDTDEVATTDVVIAEVLQGTRTEARFAEFSELMGGLHYLPASRETWIRAAELSFQLMRRGFATPLSDLVIATVALDNDVAVFARDEDFSRVVGLKLHEVGS